MKIIGGEFKGRTLKTPKGPVTRPTTSLVRGALFNICRQQLDNARCLDLFAGSGALGIEALSLGAREAIFIERDRKAIEALKENLKQFNLQEQTQLIAGDVFAHLKRLKGEFNLITADPPYKEKIHEELLEIISDKGLLAAAGFLFIEAPFPSELPETLGSLHKVASRLYGKTVLHHFTTSP